MIHRTVDHDGREFRSMSLTNVIAIIGILSAALIGALSWGYTRGTITREVAEAIGAKIGLEVQQQIMQIIEVEKRAATLEHNAFRESLTEHNYRIIKLEDWRTLHVDGHAARR